ncbi:hypothetical protein OIU84_023765 [Salix udensis]|uniref:Uncharacterized protein n=1 Tax=Salix udensis TaxID=889485 RepID=A0AAD6PHB1_9ROSI|nr:hypothetical protein OIU84_023765 [Salix udensis]
MLFVSSTFETRQMPVLGITLILSRLFHTPNPITKVFLAQFLRKEGRMPDVSGFVSGAFKIALRQLKRDDSTSSVSKSSKPPNDSLMAQVTSLRHELQMLASSRPVTIVTANGTGLGFDPSLASETGDE